MEKTANDIIMKTKTSPDIQTGRLKSRLLPQGLQSRKGDGDAVTVQ